MLQIKVILSSVREGRFGDKPAEWILQHLQQSEGVSVELLDVKNYLLPFFNDPVSPSMLKEPYAHPDVARWTQKIAEADAFVIVTPEYNHAYPASLKNNLDWVYKEWNNKPVAFVAYGAVGGARAVEQLRQVAVELQMAPIRNAIHIPFEYVMKTYEQPNISPAELLKSFDQKAEGLIHQLVWWGNALQVARTK